MVHQDESFVLEKMNEKSESFIQLLKINLLIFLIDVKILRDQLWINDKISQLNHCQQ